MSTTQGYFKHIYEQSGALSTLNRAIESEQIAQSYLFVGPQGVGKTTTAWQFAHVANGRSLPNDKTPADTENNPDIRIFRPRDEGSRNLPVEVLREEVLPFTRYAPFQNKRAFVIFKDADISFPKHHAQAANSLLKTLEEPKENVHFILCASNAARLLPTIRSRCQQVRFNGLSDQALEQILNEHAVEPTQQKSAIRLAEQSASRALELAENNLSEELWNHAVAIDAACARNQRATQRTAAILKTVENIHKHEHRDQILQALALYYQTRAKQDLGIDSTDGNEAEHTKVRQPNSQVYAHRFQSIQRALKEITVRNANPQITLEALLLHF